MSLNWLTENKGKKNWMYINAEDVNYAKSYVHCRLPSILNADIETYLDANAITAGVGQLIVDEAANAPQVQSPQSNKFSVSDDWNINYNGDRDIDVQVRLNFSIDNVDKTSPNDSISNPLENDVRLEFHICVIDAADNVTSKAKLGEQRLRLNFLHGTNLTAFFKLEPGDTIFATIRSAGEGATVKNSDGQKYRINNYQLSVVEL